MGFGMIFNHLKNLFLGMDENDATPAAGAVEEEEERREPREGIRSRHGTKKREKEGSLLKRWNGFLDKKNGKNVPTIAKLMFYIIHHSFYCPIFILL